jgi:hypothetical protein
MKKIMDFLKGNVKLGSFFGSTLFWLQEIVLNISVL